MDVWGESVKEAGPGSTIVALQPGIQFRSFSRHESGKLHHLNKPDTRPPCRCSRFRTIRRRAFQVVGLLIVDIRSARSTTDGKSSVVHSTIDPDHCGSPLPNQRARHSAPSEIGVRTLKLPIRPQRHRLGSHLSGVAPDNPRSATPITSYRAELHIFRPSGIGMHIFSQAGAEGYR